MTSSSSSSPSSNAIIIDSIHNTNDNDNDHDDDGDCINSSQLGTQQYWESCYRQEIANYNHYQDIGEIWFGSNLMRKIVAWIKDNIDNKLSPILDIGCGNGHLIIELNKAGFHHLTGLDYAASSIQFTRQLCDVNNVTNVHLYEEDLLNLSDNLTVQYGQFRLAIDKGTFDAICLNPNANLTQIKQQYINTLAKLIDKHGFMLIASCNWTRNELITLFHSLNLFTLIAHIETPTLQFGGKTGNSVACLIFRKN